MAAERLGTEDPRAYQPERDTDSLESLTEDLNGRERFPFRVLAGRLTDFAREAGAASPENIRTLLHVARDSAIVDLERVEAEEVRR